MVAPVVNAAMASAVAAAAENNGARKNILNNSFQLHLIKLGRDFAFQFSRELDAVGIGSFRYSVFKVLSVGVLR